MSDEPVPPFRRPVVLVLLGCFWPGNDASGPNQSVRALAMALADEFEFRIIARHASPLDHAPQSPSSDWVDLGFAKMRYCEIGIGGAVGLRQILRDEPYDLLWLNSIFDRDFTQPALFMRRLGIIPERPALLSPRGECGIGALRLKPVRKRMFLRLARFLNLWSGVVLQATSDTEARDIANAIDGSRTIAIASDMRDVTGRAFVQAEDDTLRLTFVGRISPVKQLHVALDSLGQVNTRVAFSIYGPAEDRAYWRQCGALIASLPPNIRVRWHGETDNEEIIAALARTDLFFLPTAGENFGHAIFEALASGVPVLISDQTPWRNLAQENAGWDLSLGDPAAFAAAIDAFAAMPEDARAKMRDGARAVALAWHAVARAESKSRDLLRRMVHATPETGVPTA